MQYKRILTIQDISCVGQCSMTVAMPILSACGLEVCILPTAVLSTHTGGFGKPVIQHLTASMEDTIRHWLDQKITFDGVLVGYLGSTQAVRILEKYLEALLAPGGISIVDPAMADHGRRYSGLDEAYAEAMESLCRRAHIILPNITEAAMFTGLACRETLDEDYVNRLLDELNHPCVVLTGVGYGEGETGAVYDAGQNRYRYTHQKLGGSFHGTGDMFAACFTGALLQGKTGQEAVGIASDFVGLAIAETLQNPAHWYGVKFETVLPELIRRLQN